MDATLRPAGVQRLLDELPRTVRVINANIADTRKSTVTDWLSAFGLCTPSIVVPDHANAPVFVKSNFNAGDAPRRVYKVTTAADAQDLIAADPTLIAQRHVREDVGPNGLGRLRRLIVVGAELVQLEYFSHATSIKRSSSQWQYSRDVRCLKRDCQFLGSPSMAEHGFHFADIGSAFGHRLDVVKRWLRHIGLDFGTLDIVTPSSGEFFILDVNPTPWERGLPNSLARLLARALVALSQEGPDQ